MGEQEFIARVRVERTSLGWSQSELARRLRKMGCRLHQQTIATIEAGERRLRIDEAQAIATVFGYTLTEMLADRATPSLLPGFTSGQVEGLRRIIREELEAAREFTVNSVHVHNPVAVDPKTARAEAIQYIEAYRDLARKRDA